MVYPRPAHSKRQSPGGATGAACPLVRRLWEGKPSRVPRRHLGSDAWGMLDWMRLALLVLRAARRARTDLVRENLLLRHQLAVLARPTRRQRVRLRRLDTLRWVRIRRVRRDWRRYLVVVTPDTVVRWHRAGWRLYWRWTSRGPAGRPRLNPEIQEQIARMTRENPPWGSERIRGELLKLGLVVSNRSVRRYRWRTPARPPTQTWRTFLADHAHAIWAADLLVAQTLTFKTLYVLLYIAHARRELVHLAVTAHPTAAWVWRHLVEATPWGRRPTHLIRDRDAVYGGAFRARAEALGIEPVRTPVRAPRADAVAERVIGTFRRKYLDHVIPLNEGAPPDDPHRNRRLLQPGASAPDPAPRDARPASRSPTGAALARPWCSGACTTPARVPHEGGRGSAVPHGASSVRARRRGTAPGGWPRRSERRRRPGGPGCQAT